MLNEYHALYREILSIGSMYQPTATASESILLARLRNLRAFLELLDNPDRALKCIHVAGTSGKGSTAMLIQANLVAAKHVTSAILSPHTTTYLERFPLGQGLVPVKTFNKAARKVLKRYEEFLRNGGQALGFAALTLSIGLTAAREAGAEYIVIETGVGGRFDWSNVIENPVACIVTNCDKDHTEVLGSTLEEIATSHAGIIKPNCLAVVGEARAKLKHIFCDAAVDNEAALFFVRGEGAGDERNTLIAERVLEELDIPFSQKEPRIACRFETMPRSQIIIDGAHNEAKIQNTVRHMKSIRKKPIVLFACVSRKNAAPLLKELSKIALTIHPTRFDAAEKVSANPAVLSKLIPKERRGTLFLNPHEALKKLKKEHKDRPILVTGSFFLAGSLRTHWYTEDDILKAENSFPV